MKKLLKIYDFRTEYDYYGMVIDSHTNGQFGQAREQFFAMPKNYRKAFVLYCNGFVSDEYFLFFFNLL